jgi:hypothetical protein
MTNRCFNDKRATRCFLLQLVQRVQAQATLALVDEGQLQERT